MNEFTKSYELSKEIIDQFSIDTLLPIARKVADELYTHLNDNIVRWLANDAELNLAGYIRSQSESCIDALILGDVEMLKRYPYQEFERGRKLREALVRHCNDDLMKMRIKDLEDEVKRLKEDLEFYRGYRP